MAQRQKAVYRARYVLDGTTVRQDAALEIADGCVVAVRQAADLEAGEVVDLGEVALVPGLVNAHSHAFQRAIRGRTEYLAADRPTEDFWTWRDQMYRAALGLDADAFEAVCELCFVEMALAGITAVGEFHYVHHQPDGTPYDDPNELAHRAIRAARRVGLRICLLRVGYQRGGFEIPASRLQRRFVEPDVATYLARAEALGEAWADDPGVSVGLAPHSIRAVERDWIVASTDWAQRHDTPLHIHASEQLRELDESRAEYGQTPIDALDAMGALSARTTLVHATHATDDEVARMAERGAVVCACPTTERNLGDGFLPATALVAHGVPIALGSDSQANIDLFEEMRLVEYHERLRHQRRNVVASAAGALSTPAVLWPMGTSHGARALGLDAGSFAPGRAADFVAIDLDDITLAGTTGQTLLADLTLSVTPGAVRDVFVAGQPVVRNRAHERREAAVDGLREALEGVK